MNSKPLISVIVPVYNVEHYLERCLSSILTQTLENIEVVIINDGSTDSSKTICDEFAQKDKRIKLVHSLNKGVSAARNTGISIAKGDYLGFVDSDDWIYEDMFETLYNLSITTKSDITVSSLKREIDNKIIENPAPLFIKEMNNTEAMKELFKGQLYRFALWNKLYKKECFLGIRFPEGRIHEDLATSYRIFQRAAKVTYTSYAGYVYVKRPSSILTSSFNKSRLDALVAWDEILNFMNQHYPNLKNAYQNCYIYWTVDSFYSVINQVTEKEDQKEFIARIRSHVKSNRNILKSAEISRHYKTVLKMIELLPSVLKVHHYVKQKYL